MLENTFALILAAGKGTRMPSNKHKVLQTLLGDTMLSLVYYALKPILNQKIYTLVGHEKLDVIDELHKIDPSLPFIEQKELLGTGHALQTALPQLKTAKAKYILLVNGDVPLIQSDFLQSFLKEAEKLNPDLFFATIEVDNIAKYGRVLRDNAGNVQAIIEAKDYNNVLHGTPSQEINAGLYLISTQFAEEFLPLLTQNNANKEYYITDLIALGIKHNKKVYGYNSGKNNTLLGVNNPLELHEAEEILRQIRNKQLMSQGIILHSSHSISISSQAKIAHTTEIHGPCEIYGNTIIEEHVNIASHCIIKNSSIQSHTQIHAYSHIDSSTIQSHCSIGPYARIRPNSLLMEHAHIGNFVETKNTVLGPYSKANHLTYLGDSEIGSHTNIGAGTITCNYDGKNKHKTHIGNNNFIGSNTALVAPISLADNVLVGAGSVLTKNVDTNELAIARSKQANIKRR